MRELYVVAVSEDGRHVVLAASKDAAKGTFRVRLDARLVSAVRGDLGTHTADLSPKEIQARLRAGESVEKIAASAGMALTRVERFAGPVAGEMARMIDEARQAHVVRGRLGRSAADLGKAVEQALADHAKPESVAWTTRREDDGRWRVQVAWVARGRAKDAAWWYDPHVRTLEAVNAAAAALGHVDANPAPPRRTPKRAVPVPVAAPAARSKAASARVAKAPTKKTATKVAKTPATKVAKTPATKVATKAAKHVAKKHVAKKVAAAPAPQPTRKAARPAKPVRAAAGAPKAARAAGPSRPRLRVVPDPHSPKTAAAAPRTAPARTATAAERDGVKVRASVPAWADVLLGTTPSNDS